MKQSRALTREDARDRFLLSIGDALVALIRASQFTENFDKNNHIENIRGFQSELINGRPQLFGRPKVAP